MRILYLFFPLIFLFSPMSHAIEWQWLSDPDVTTEATTDSPTEAFDENGLPNHRVNISTQLDADLLADFYAMVPEKNTVDKALLASSFSNISIEGLDDDEKATVKVAFLNEGAGFTNALGYFIYETDNPPTTIAEVNHVIIMPNASKDGSDALLKSGDQVDLMVELTNGESIGFFINSNGWDSSKGYGYQKDSQYSQPFYTLTSLNPNNTTDEYKWLGQHYHVVFTDTRSTSADDEDNSAFFAFGFEDVKTTLGDNDFNDLIFSVQVTPEDSVKDYDKAEVLLPVAKIESKLGVLAFEDNWPLTGDYDFNDAVISYKITKTYDADDNNETIASLEFDYEIEALGAAFHNGLALRVLGLTEDMIESVVLKKTLNGETETITKDSLVSVKSNDDVGTVTYLYPLIKDSDSDDDYASFTISEDLFEELSTFDSDGFIYDTETCLYKTATSESDGCPEGTTSATISLTINLNSKALADSVIGEMPFDHYLFGTDKNDLYPFDRENDTNDWFSTWSSYFTSDDDSVVFGPGKSLEIHMKAFEGTSVFENDFTDESLAVDAQSYIDGNPFISLKVTEDGESSGNMPWVLDLPSDWKHPVEGVDISEAYPNFFNWVEDNTTNTDWYKTSNESALYTE